MALSTCVKCGGTLFETSEVEPLGSKFKLIFVQCAICGGVVGVLEYYNVGEMIQTLAKRLGAGEIE